MKKIMLLLAVIFLPCGAEANSFPNKAEREAVCHFLSQKPSDLSNGKPEDYTQHAEWIDINNDGIDENMQLEEGGTSHSRAYKIITGGNEIWLDGKIFESDTDEESKEAFRWLGWAKDMKWLRYDNRTYLIGYADYHGELPANVWFIDPSYNARQLCEITHKPEIVEAHATQEALNNVMDAQSICDASLKNRISTYLSFEKEEGTNIREASSTDGLLNADLNNDAANEEIHLARYSSGSGAGCDSSYLILNKDIGNFKNASLNDFSGFAKNLYSVQQIQFDTRFSVPCARYYTPKLFMHKNHVYFERSTVGQKLVETWDAFHEIWLFKGKEVYPVCNFVLKNKVEYSMTPSEM